MDLRGGCTKKERKVPMKVPKPEYDCVKGAHFDNKSQLGPVATLDII